MGQTGSILYDSCLNTRSENMDAMLAESYHNPANTLLAIQTIQTPTGSLNALFDSGSDGNLILNSYAKSNGLEGFPVYITVTGVLGMKKRKLTRMYPVVLCDLNKKEHTIMALGVDKMNFAAEADLSKTKKLFPEEEVEQVWDKVSERPSGQIHLLIGQCQAGIHPEPFSTCGDLKIMKSLFGTGFLMTGYSKEVRTTPVK